jgi:flagellar M-ring protein FliF
MTGAKAHTSRSDVLQQILSVWLNLDIRKRVLVIGSTLFMFVAIIGMSRMATVPNMTLLYSGLDASAAGEVVQALEARGVPYEIRGGTIYVSSDQRDELRMTLASDGLPANSAGGYELLDSLTGFGTTSQMFDAAYWRAKEGELARTIVSSPKIQSARVHIANPSSQPFKRQIAATASVTVMVNGGTLEAAQAKGLRYLVASAVAGLSAEDVSIIDGRTGVVTSDADGLSAIDRSGGLAEVLQENVRRLLEARVGAGHAIVEVSVEHEMDRESIVETIFDPDSRVAISSEIEESTNSSTDSRNGSVTVASNLPDGDASSNGESSSNQNETRERINYEVSETRRELQREPGAIKRLTVAVLVDGIHSQNLDTNENIWEPRSEDELAALQELVASAIGFNESRGDIITIKNMEFQPVLIGGTEVEASFLSANNINVMSIIQAGILAVVSIVLGLFVLKPILSGPSRLAEPSESLALPSSASNELPSIPIAEMPSAAALTGEIDEGDFTLPSLGVMTDFDLGDDDMGSSDDPVARLKKLIEDRQDETVEILRGWMDEAGEAAS